MMKIFEAPLTGLYLFDPLITHQYHLSLPQMCKNMVINIYEKDQFLSIRCSTALSFKSNGKMTGRLHTGIKSKSYQICFFFLYLVCQVSQTVSVTSSAKFQVLSILFSVKYRSITGPQINSRLSVTHLDLYTP